MCSCRCLDAISGVLELGPCPEKHLRGLFILEKRSLSKPGGKLVWSRIYGHAAGGGTLSGA